MQAPDLNSIHLLQIVLEQGKSWALLISGIIGTYKAFQWVKEIRTKDLKELHGSMVTMQTTLTGLGERLDTQTEAVVSELREMRSDFRTFYTAPVQQMIPARAKPIRVVKPKGGLSKVEAS